MKIKILSLFIAMIICLTAPISIYAATVSDLEKEQQNVEKKKDEAEEKLDEIKEEKSETLKEIESLDNKISDSEEKLDELKVQSKELEDSIKTAEEEIKVAQEKYNKNKELMDKRLIALHEAGETSFLDVLLNAKSITDFVSRYFTVQELAEYDSQLLDSIEEERKSIEAKKQELDKRKAQVDENKKAQEEVSSELKSAKLEKDEKVAELSEEEKKTQKEIDNYNAAIKNVEKQITEMLKQAEQQMNNSSSSSGSSGMKFDGSFIWPCNNKVVTSAVKRRWGRWHKGIDIGARYENVYASASGYAYNASNPGGYGTYIMIVHGSGYITLYGHLQSSKIKSGQYVKQGQVIATSGNSGASQGAHLHFEIRKCNSISSMFTSGNNFLDPLDYLPGGYTFTAGAKTES